MRPCPTPVYDFGFSPEQVAAIESIPTPTLRDIAAMIIDEDDLVRLGRWGGDPAPKRWIPLL